MPVQITNAYALWKVSASIRRGLMVCLLWLGIANAAMATVLDEAVVEDALLGTIGEALAAYGIDVTTNLNSREVVSRRIEQPRLGRFPDLPQNQLPTSDEIRNWEAEFSSAQIGGLVILAASGSTAQDDVTGAETIAQWLSAASSARMFVTFHKDDLVAIEKIQQVADAYAFRSRLFANPLEAAVAGEFYSTAAQRLALDSRSARRFDSTVTELEYLGERVRRDSNSLFNPGGRVGDTRLERSEPAKFLKETLGDEFNQSTIREIIVPGGVALGESASLGVLPASLLFSEGKLVLRDEDNRHWELPAEEPATLKALFDFVNRSRALQSDAMVDIDADGRVRIAEPLRDTDAGFALMAADTRPFEYVRNLAVTKSVIVDTAVNWISIAPGNTLQFETDFEVRFLSADNMRIAQTRVALEYTYASISDAVSYVDSWGRDAASLHDSLDYTGLGASVGVVANYAGWIGLFRTLAEEQIPFLHGRYAFMKLDKSGRSTPARYQD